MRPTSPLALAPSGQCAVPLVDDSVAGPPTVIAAAVLEADDLAGPHPLWDRCRGACSSRRCRLSCRYRRCSSGRHHQRPSSSPGEAPWHSRPTTSQALLPLSPLPPLGPTSWAALSLSERCAVALADNSAAGLQPIFPPPPSRSVSTPALTPSGRGAMSLAADVVVGPPAAIATAADREAVVSTIPHPHRKKRRGACGRQRCRPSCFCRRRP